MTSISKKAGRGPGAVAARKQNKGNGQRTTGHGKKQRPKRARKDGQSLSSGLGAAFDELLQIDWLLQTVPDIRIAVWLADRALDPRCRGAAEAPDRLAQWARDAFGVELDAEVQDDDDADTRSKMNDPDLRDLPSVIPTIIDAARWRLLRVAKAVSLARRAAK